VLVTQRGLNLLEDRLVATQTEVALNLIALDKALGRVGATLQLSAELLARAEVLHLIAVRMRPAIVPSLAPVADLPFPTPPHVVEAERRPQDVPREALDGGCVLRLDSNSIVDRESSVPPRQQELRALVRQQPLVLLEAEHLVAEERLRRVLVYPEGVMYGRVQAVDVGQIIEEHLLGNRPVERLKVDPEIWE